MDIHASKMQTSSSKACRGLCMAYEFLESAEHSIPTNPPEGADEAENEYHPRTLTCEDQRHRHESPT